MFDSVGWPPGQRRLARRELGRDIMHRRIAALVDTVATAPTLAHARYRPDNHTAPRTNEVRVIVTVGTEIYYTTRTTETEQALAAAEAWVQQNVDLLMEQPALLAV